ncbi:MAG TPA: TAXI family TRAP transporter solute-binding subunit [Casimicrobiaceae bacterium]|nr:TAXI family TRAP transporter solute-binding subunit [Casimicrobiaceae bacterium]
MTTDDPGTLSRREKWRLTALVLALAVVSVWFSVRFLEPAPSRHIVLASGPAFGLYHRYAQRYVQALARDGVVVEERTTEGAAENLRLLRDPKSGVDVAFLQGGILGSAEETQLEMLASLYYEPLWVFYRNPVALTQINQLQGKRLAVGSPGSGTRAFVEPLLAFNGIQASNSTVVQLGGDEAMQALRNGEVDAVFMVGGAQTPIIVDALRNPSLRLMSFGRADAYTRRFPYITKLALPPGTIDLARDIPSTEVTMIATKAMLVARPGLHPALVNLLADAAGSIHSQQGHFEAAGEFPGFMPVDLPVSEDAARHRKFGPSFIHRVLPFWVATFVERMVILLVPLIVILVPAINFFPGFLRQRVRSRVYRWYGELALLERDVHTRAAPFPVDRWLSDLDRIEQAVEGIKMPASLASEAYTLREHVELVRRAVLARAGMPVAS